MRSDQTTRPAAAAGPFYPEEPDRLEALVLQYLNEAGAPADCEEYPLVKAVIVPHAAYPYSGAVAASAFVHLACDDVPVKRFVLLGPAHHAPVRGLAVSSAAAFDTPFGRVPADEAAREALLALPGVTVDDDAHAPEHSLEVQLPFLQTLFLDFTITPLLVGDAPAEAVAAALEAVWGGPETRIVISSDLSHFHPHDTARWLDRETAEAIVGLRPDGLGDDSACGCQAIAGLLLAARWRGLSVRLLDLRSSADAEGLRDRVVGPRDRVGGYGSFIFTCPTPAL